MLKWMLLVLFLGLETQARVVTINCTNQDRNSMQIKAHDLLWLNPAAPEIMDFKFELNGSIVRWSGIQHLSVPVDGGSYATLLKKDAMNAVFFQQSKKNNLVSATATVDRQFFEFNCKKSY